MDGQQIWGFPSSWKRIGNVLRCTWKVLLQKNAVSTSAVAINLLRKLTDFKFGYMLHLLLGYVVILKNLFLLFQRERLFLSTTDVHMKNTMASTKSLYLIPGQYEEIHYQHFTEKYI
jgi:hypothetical protein